MMETQLARLLDPGVQGDIGPAPPPPPGRPPYPPDARGVDVGIHVAYKFVYEGDPKLCKCKFQDSGSIRIRTRSHSVEGCSSSGIMNFDQPSDTHDVPCNKQTIHRLAGIHTVVGPLRDQ